MSRLAFLTSLMAVTVAAQAEYTAHGFEYVGCVEAEPPVFSYNVDLPPPFSPQQCQIACHAKGKYAALDGSCHCEDPLSKNEPQYKVLDDSVCILPCFSGNTSAGWCGGPQCPVTGKKRYSLYKKDEEHHHDDDCEEDKDKGIGIGFRTNDIPTRTSTTIKTITSCPPEVTDCPLSCPPGGCHIDPPPPITTHHEVPTFKPAISSPPPECPGEHCKTNVPTSSACPPEGCVKIITDPAPTRPHPTHDLAPTKTPVTISEGARYRSGVLIAAVTVLVVAVSWL